MFALSGEPLVGESDLERAVSYRPALELVHSATPLETDHRSGGAAASTADIPMTGESHAHAPQLTPSIPAADTLPAFRCTYEADATDSLAFRIGSAALQEMRSQNCALALV
jgi:hypothetical protein